MASATGLFSFFRMLFISMGVSLSTTFWSRRENFYQNRYVGYVTPANQAYQPYKEQLHLLGIEGRPADAALYEMVQNQAYTMSFLDLCYGAAWGFVALFLLIFLFRSEKAAQKRTKRVS